MKMLFQQREFSWFDKYNVCDEFGNTLFVVNGKGEIGNYMPIYDNSNKQVGLMKEQKMKFLTRVDMYVGELFIGDVKKEFSIFKPRVTLDCNGWQVEGNWIEWDYRVLDSKGQIVMKVSKTIWDQTDTYQIDVVHEKDMLSCLIVALAIEAEK